MTNVLVPTAFEVWNLLVLALLIVPAVLAFISIARTRSATGTEKALWVLIVLIAPLVGAILWFTIGRRSAASRS